MSVPASKEAARGDNTASILVDQSSFAQAMSILEARGLPSQNYQSFCEVFQKDGIVSSPVEERARYLCALSQELNRTVAEIDGILSARIHVVLPESDILGRDMKPSSASVSIRHLPNIPVEALTPSIKMLVANSIEGLIYDNVTVVSFAATDLPERSATPQFTTFLGVHVHPASMGRLQMLLGSALAVALLAIGIAALPHVLRGLGRRGRDAGEEPDLL